MTISTTRTGTFAVLGRIERGEEFHAEGFYPRLSHEDGVHNGITTTCMNSLENGNKFFGLTSS